MGCCACCAEAGPDTAALYSLKLQSVVLAAASPGHFRGYCTRLKGTGRGPSSAQAGEQRTPAAAVLRRASDTADQDTQSNATVDQAYAYRLTLFTGEPEGVPRAVLHHAYTGALPDDTEQLIRVSKNAQCTEGIWHRRDLKSDPEQLIWVSNTSHATLSSKGARKLSVTALADTAQVKCLSAPCMSPCLCNLARRCCSVLTTWTWQTLSVVS